MKRRAPAAIHDLLRGHSRVRLGEAGGGVSLWNALALNRWPGDAVEDAHGFFLYLRDTDDDRLWSAGLQPVAAQPAHYAFAADAQRLRIERRDADIATRLDVELIDDGVERRRLTLRNASSRRRRIEVTSYLEIALAPPQADLAHPAFLKLFVQTAWQAAPAALLARRRPRAKDECWPTLFHTLRGAPIRQWETDRVRCVGRGRSVARPAFDLRGTTGNVLDAAFCLRTHVELAPGETRVLDFLLGAAADDDVARTLLQKHAPDAVAEPSAVAAHDDAGAPRARFSEDGREYLLRLEARRDGLRLPPMPWVNVIANPRFGTIVSETGAACTWAGNSQAWRLTPWANDPVCDPHDEALYLRDEDDGHAWTPLPGPLPAAAPYDVRHGFGYTRFELQAEGLRHETTVFVDRELPLKFVRLCLRNTGTRPRRLSLYAYQRLVLGTLPDPAGVRSWRHEDVLCAARERGPIAFTLVLGDGETRSVSTDRAHFLGIGGSPHAPRALREAQLEAAPGDGSDPCFARQVALHLPAGARLDCCIALGSARDADELRQLVALCRQPGAVEAAFAAARDAWRDALDGIRVRTPAPELDAMINGWLPYQALSCRLHGRSALYQSSGAYGFRDQLQDAGNLSLLWPQRTRAQILLHASRQFVEGDVLHWWHEEDPPRGVRTRFADDLLWLPFVALRYVRETGDAALLDEPVPFLAAPPLDACEDERYAAFTAGGETASVYEHCARAIERALTAGAHGLPLMGSGDWNDGMNRVGREGRGESVWLGFFLCDILAAFVPLARARGDAARAERGAAYRERLAAALNDSGWDGGWYRRAYYDDGTPLGTRDASECRIDGLVQAWAVLSGIAPPARAAQAMDAVEAQLVDAAHGLIRLLTPPFVDAAEDPGYIKGYVAGVRENGGQYTHAACWMVAAFAALGRRDRAAPLLAMLSPMHHTRDAAAVARYQVEPYVIAADIYGAAPHAGRGGWTWYTGAAGWAFRVALEAVLGLALEDGRTLRIGPCVPDDWPGYRIDYRVPGGTTRYEIEVRNTRRCSAAVVAATLDDAALPVDHGVARIPLCADGATHRVTLDLGPWPDAAIQDL
ncbi:GH36-type glycosyl hydrolase domain-containing protein [Solimonas soli]|uniref:GH36-type glycosyl hydrolase domain-containing protein n=1 Tax=Solimonas soli TaxID=413479 RepID=UPI00048A436F|nr:glycosyl transferase [Solimonas soli]